MKANTSPIQSTQRGTFNEWLVERTGWKGLTYPVPAHANTIWYLLGGISFVGFLILFATGIYMAQFYSAQPSESQQSVVYLITGVPLGDLIRSIHYWTAQIVTLTVILHFLRILVTAAYKKPRELNWFVGLGLLVITLGAVYTGSVLKYDQEGLEALQHAKEAGGLMGVLGAFFTSEFSRSVSLLTRFFTVHTAILPLAFAALIGIHIYLINQHGISPKATIDATARNTKGEGESRFDIHLRSMIGYGLILLSIVVLLALILPAPIGQPGVPGAEVTKPWWMFVWLFPAEAALGARALIIAPSILGLLLVLVPILDRSPYLSPLKRKGILIVAGILLLIIVISGIVAALQPVAGHLNKLLQGNTVKTINSISLVLLTTLVLAFMPSNIVLADGVPVIIVEPNPSVPGGQITVTGTDMEDGEIFAITLEGMTGVVPIGEATAIPDGQEAGFAVTFTIPDDLAPGSYFLRAVTEGGETATADLTISVSAEQMSTEPLEASAEPLVVERPKSPLMVGSVILLALVNVGVGVWLIRIPDRPNKKTEPSARFGTESSFDSR